MVYRPGLGPPVLQQPADVVIFPRQLGLSAVSPSFGLRILWQLKGVLQ